MMEQDSLIFITTIILSGFLSLTVSVFCSQLICNFLKIPALPKLRPGKQEFNTARSKSENQRRKTEIKPGIICSFPIYQEKRREAPMS
jgi:hypothetical protein